MDYSKREEKQEEEIKQQLEADDISDLEEEGETEMEEVVEENL